MFDFIGITEVFEIRDHFNYTLNGYHRLQYNTRPNNDDGHGGVALFIKEHYTFSIREELSIFIPHVIETIFVEVQNKSNKPIIIGVIYRPNFPPRANLDVFVNKLLEIQAHIANENKTAYLMGDYNINLLNFGTHNKTNDFLNDVLSQGFLPYIMKPTRITPTSATLIDHIYSNHRCTHSKSGIILIGL